MTETDVQNNGLLLFDKLKALGWDDEHACAGVIVAFLFSHINPIYSAGTCWDSASTTIRYGIFQVPAEEYLEWCKTNSYDETDGDVQAQYFDYQLRNNLVWYGIDEDCCSYYYLNETTCGMTSSDWLDEYADWPFFDEYACLLIEGYYNVSLFGSGNCYQKRVVTTPYKYVATSNEQVANYFSGCLLNIGYECNSYYPSSVGVMCDAETPIEEYVPRKMPVYFMIRKRGKRK